MRSLLVALTLLPASLTAHPSGATGSQAASLAARVAEAEATVARHFRGEPLEAARAKVVADIAAYNAETAASKAALEAGKADLDAQLKPLRALEAQLEEMDQRLAKLPTATEGRNSPAELKHAALMKERNALAARYTALQATVEPRREAYNAKVKASNEALTARRAAVMEAQKRVNTRIDAFEAFQKQNGDVAFYASLAKLLGDCLKASDAPAAARVRALRRELMAWAMARAAAQPFGPVLVEVQIGGEPCCLMVDTGAMRTSLAPELIGVLGLQDRLGEEASFVLAGGVRLRGRMVDLPSVTVAGTTAKAVPAVVITGSEVGIDGLLGQSFLKGFIYTVDERKAEKLTLQPRKP
ncbi:MAG TPA: retroviral-like aspartic protease family protein [Holophagaceae bacterium]|nr:retroviral-like aspartic protease family protein [Holophagaceae bacterium]